jgi:hypothetical protein
MRSLPEAVPVPLSGVNPRPSENRRFIIYLVRLQGRQLRGRSELSQNTPQPLNALR